MMRAAGGTCIVIMSTGQESEKIDNTNMSLGRTPLGAKYSSYACTQVCVFVHARVRVCFSCVLCVFCVSC